MFLQLLHNKPITVGPDVLVMTVFKQINRFMALAIFLGLFFPHDTETVHDKPKTSYLNLFFFPVMKFEFPTEFAF